MPLGGVNTGVAYRQRGLFLWLQVFGVVFFFFLFGVFIILAIILAGAGPSAAAVCVPLGLFSFAFDIFILCNLIWFRSQYATLRDDGISFRLAPLDRIFVMPWKLQSGSLPWSGVRALDVKLRSVVRAQHVYVLRTTAGDITFFWPQWPNAEAIAQDIIRRSGASTSTEDMELAPVVDPNQPHVNVATSIGERFMRGFGTVMLIIIALLGVLGLFAFFGAKPEDRWDIGKVFIFLAIVASVAQGLRRYRRIR